MPSKRSSGAASRNRYSGRRDLGFAMEFRDRADDTYTIADVDIRQRSLAREDEQAFGGRGIRIRRGCLHEKAAEVARNIRVTVLKVARHDTGDAHDRPIQRTCLARSLDIVYRHRRWSVCSRPGVVAATLRAARGDGKGNRQYQETHGVRL
jgi:hypothetical protein